MCGGPIANILARSGAHEAAGKIGVQDNILGFTSDCIMRDHFRRKRLTAVYYVGCREHRVWADQDA